MKKVILVMAILAIGISSNAQSFSELFRPSEKKFLFSSSYGVSAISKAYTPGFSTSQSLLYMPINFLALGVNAGYSQSNLKNVPSDENGVCRTVSVGPVLQIYPVNIDHHRLFAGVGASYLHFNNVLYYQYIADGVDKDGNPISVSGEGWEQEANDWCTFDVCGGYSYRFNKTFELGVKVEYRSSHGYSFTSGLVSLGISF